MQGEVIYKMGFKKCIKLLEEIKEDNSYRELNRNLRKKINKEIESFENRDRGSY